MAITQNTYTGNGSTVLFSFTFPYLETTDIKVSLNGSVTNAYTLANATTIQFNTAPANGVAIRIYRQTDDADLAAQFYPGSAIRSQDLNDNFTQNLYVTQESVREAEIANTTADAADAKSDTAITNSTTALSNSATALSNSATALSQSNTAIANSATALSNSTTAINTANAATATANAAAAAVANAQIFVIVAAVANIPGSPSDGDAIEVTDATGIESFTPLAGIPAGFTGDSGLSVRIVYSSAGSTWNWVQYFPSDPDARYPIQGELGTAASPAYYFDANTGIYSPGADQVAISTNGTGRLFIGSSGNVGLGTLSAQATLHVDHNTNAEAYTIIENSQNYGFGVGIDFKQPFANAGSSIIGGRILSDYESDNNSFLSFSTLQSSTLGEKLRITSAGNVGIGTTAVNYPLSVKSTTNGGVAIFDLDNLDDGNYGGLRVHLGKTDRECRLEATYNSSFFTFWTDNAERARIDSSGRLLVGTSSTTRNRTVVLQGDPTGVNNAGAINLQANATPASAGTSVGLIDAGNTAGIGASIEFRSDGAWGTGDYPGRIEFSTTADSASSPTERMRIASNGSTNFFNSSSTTFVFGSALAAGTSDNFMLGLSSRSTNTSGGNTEFVVRTNGNVLNTNNSYGSISDVKLKENIADANSQWNDLKALQVRNYNFKEGQTHTQIGLIAQEVELVSPGLVSESPDRDAEGNDLGTVTKSVNYSVLYMKAVKALQEAMERIETLEAKVAALEGV